MTINKKEISDALTAYKAAVTAASDKNALASDIRDLVEAFNTAWVDVKGNLQYNANGLYIRKGNVKWMGIAHLAPFNTLQAALASEAASTLKEISDALTAKLNGKEDDDEV